MECVCLRVKDVEFERREIVVRSGKGDKDRVTMLPGSLVQTLQAHLERVRETWLADRASDRAGVQLQNALDRKYPNASLDGGGSGSFRHLPRPKIRALELSVGIISMSRICNVQSSWLFKLPGSQSRQRHIRCAIRSLPICCNPAMTSEPCRSCSAIPMFRRR
jgi:hypothetical protein